MLKQIVGLSSGPVAFIGGYRLFSVFALDSSVRSDVIPAQAHPGLSLRHKWQAKKI